MLDGHGSYEGLIGTQGRLIDFFFINTSHTNQVGRCGILFAPIGKDLIILPRLRRFIKSIAQTFPNECIDFKIGTLNVDKLVKGATDRAMKEVNKETGGALKGVLGSDGAEAEGAMKKLLGK